MKQSIDPHVRCDGLLRFARNDGALAVDACNTLFTIFVDPVFTTFMRRAFTKAPDAARLGCAIA
ncbi:hypothetical protein HAP47_0011875 [Bradyrhizobium sp. 41S5]|uniref:hypothetical protein n=1 Tax=Bradyrhizobium sp. 41S5 TaxID=1404443 RepID=UPI00156AC3DF|nr:hypothetical protein [Bradyrhizobium sp. 41S5]UFX47316.1 hypothetical protein HAP47_0011875 [Bradyrhizobium sp. 41S5]